MKKKVVGYLALILDTAMVLLLIAGAGKNGNGYLSTLSAKNIEKCEVTMA